MWWSSSRTAGSVSSLVALAVDPPSSARATVTPGGVSGTAGTPEAMHTQQTGPAPGPLTGPADALPLAEPPDGTRIEFEAATDLEAAVRNDEDSVRAGWPADHGWLVYGRSVPMTWTQMLDEFGYHALRYAVRLVPVAEDEANRLRWPTVVYAATGAMPREETGRG